MGKMKVRKIRLQCFNLINSIIDMFDIIINTRWLSFRVTWTDI